MSVAKCQAEVSSSEFTEWLVYLEMEPNMFHREDYYWAEIIAWLKRAVVASPSIVKTEDCLITFKQVPKKQKKKLGWQQKAAAAKSFFNRLTAITTAKSVIEKRTR